MRARRRLKGFERVGSLPADDLGLPRKQAKELVLAAAWKRVAGEAIARRASAQGIRRGVLEIRVHDERWRATLKSVLPSLAARLTRLYPELGVRKFTLRGDDGPTAVGEQDEPVRELEKAVARESAIETTAEQTPGERLASAMERYLDCSARRSPPRSARRP